MKDNDEVKALAQADVARALAEDVGTGDLTAGLIDPARRARARILARETAVICGRPWVEAALGGKVPCGPVNQPVDLFSDPPIKARDMLVAVDQPQGRPVVQVNTPIRFTETPAGIYARPPKLGEHSDEIRAELTDGRLAPRPS